MNKSELKVIEQESGLSQLNKWTRAVGSPPPQSAYEITNYKYETVSLKQFEGIWKGRRSQRFRISELGVKKLRGTSKKLRK